MQKHGMMIINGKLHKGHNISMQWPSISTQLIMSMSNLKPKWSMYRNPVVL